MNELNEFEQIEQKQSMYQLHQALSNLGDSNLHLTTDNLKAIKKQLEYLSLVGKEDSVIAVIVKNIEDLVANSHPSSHKIYLQLIQLITILAQSHQQVRQAEVCEYKRLNEIRLSEQSPLRKLDLPENSENIE